MTYKGTTCLLAEPRTQDGKLFPFRFDGFFPEKKAWPYRLLHSTEADALTNEALADILKSKPPTLFADWEEISSELGRITLYVPKDDGKTGSFTALVEPGPEIKMGMDKAKQEPATPKRAPEPEAPDLSF